jgi:hypothetical protein
VSIVLAHGPIRMRCPWHGSACEHGCNKKLQAASNLLNPHLFHATRSSSGAHIETHDTRLLSHEPRGRIARHAGGSVYVAAAGTTPIRSIGGVPARRRGCAAGRCRRLRPRAHMVVARAGQEKCCAEVWCAPLRVQGALGARAALRAYMQNTVAAAASPLPPSIPPQSRGRTCTHTHLCLFLGFRI